MKRRLLLTRRQALLGGVAAVGGLVLPGCGRELPPTYGNVLRMGDAFTYAAHRTLLRRHALVREYSRRHISSFPAIGTTNPGDPAQRYFSATLGPAYSELGSRAFADWRLTVEGRVSRPGRYSLDDLKRFTARTQITRQTCEEGWSAIAEWTGAPLRLVLEHAGIEPAARFVQFHTYDEFADGLDLFDALHPQTILAYGMNGRDLPIPHGAPVRLRVETQLGYKSLKYLHRIVVTDTFEDHGEFGPLQNGWAWYAGI